MDLVAARGGCARSVVRAVFTVLDYVLPLWQLLFLLPPLGTPLGKMIAPLFPMLVSERKGGARGSVAKY